MLDFEFQSSHFTENLSYKDRLLALELLPLTYYKAVKALVFFYKAFHGLIGLNINDYLTFVSHGRKRLSKNASPCNAKKKVLKTSFCKFTSFQASYFNRIVKL